MTSAQSTSQATLDRLRELDYALRQAIRERDGEGARNISELQSEILLDALAQEPEDADGAWIREMHDRLLECLDQAKVACEDLRSDITGLNIQRKLRGTAVFRNRGRAGRSYLA